MGKRILTGNLEKKKMSVGVPVKVSSLEEQLKIGLSTKNKVLKGKTTTNQQRKEKQKLIITIIIILTTITIIRIITI